MSAGTKFDKSYGDFAKSTGGRVTYDEKTHRFGSGTSRYEKQSEVKKNMIQNEKGLKKVKDEVLFTLNKWSGIQKLSDQIYIEKDLHAVYKLPNSWERNYLYNEIANEMAPKETAFLTTLQVLAWGVPLTIFTTLSVLKTVDSMLDTYNALRAEYANELRFSKLNWRRNILERPQNLERVRNFLSGTEETVLGRDCPLCWEEMESVQNSVVHCRGVDGQLARNAVPYHTDCLENWRQTQRASLRQLRNPRAIQYRYLEDMPCPTCNAPMVSDDTLQQWAPETPYHPPPTFPRYVANKMVLNPLSKMGNSLSKAVTEFVRPLQGFQPIGQEEGEGLEMQENLHLD